MAAPNLTSPTTIKGRTARTSLSTTSVTSVLANASGSGKVLKINSIFAANINGATAADISISIYDGTTDVYLAYTISVPPDATQIISTKETYFYLEEGDSIRATAGTANYISVVVGYEEFA
jgi:hypothetical protein